MKASRLVQALVILGLAYYPALAQEGPPVAAPMDRQAWEPGIQKVFDQLNMLGLFAAATNLGGITVKVPRELQQLPMQMIEGADELRNRGIEIYVKELTFRDLNFIYDKSPQWVEGKPLIPTLVEFGRLGVLADAKTKVGVIPVGAEFDNGKMPVEFLPMPGKGYDLRLLPEARSADTRLDDVKLKVGGPLATGIANRFFSKKVAKLILEHGVGQTLQMGKGDLLSGDAAGRLLDVPGDSKEGAALDVLMDLLK